MSAWCTYCGDEFTPIEGTGSVDPDEPAFCSEEHRERQTALEDAEEAYKEGRSTAAPVWP